jgi:uncharacterized tellurite resistance protein B-like protein
VDYHPSHEASFGIFCQFFPVFAGFPDAKIWPFAVCCETIKPSRVRMARVGSANGTIRRSEETFMADWRNLVTKLILQDGVVDENEVKVLKKELYADGVIDKKEVDFLIELRNKSKQPSPAFTRFFFKAIEDNVLKDGKIDGAEAKWLKKMLYADGKIDDDEKKFLKDLKKKAKSTGPAFNALYDEIFGEPAAKPAAKKIVKKAKMKPGVKVAKPAKAAPAKPAPAAPVVKVKKKTKPKPAAPAASPAPTPEPIAPPPPPPEPVMLASEPPPESPPAM